MHSIVFDIGGTHMRCAVSDGEARLFKVEKDKIPSFIDGLSPAQVWQGLKERIEEYASKVADTVEEDSQVVVSFPGPIEFPSKILDAPTLVGGDRSIPDLASEIERATGHPCSILNDLSAAAWYLKRKIPDDRFIVVTISSGIGSKVFDRAHPCGVLDNLAFAGEIGHIAVDTLGETILCDCGGTNHLGSISSGRGVERFAAKVALSDPEGFKGSACVKKFNGTAETLTNEEHIAKAAKLGDPWALNVISRATSPLARILLSITVASGLDKVVIIGGFALSLGEVYLEILKNEMIKICDYDIISEKIEDLFIMGSVSEEACLEGAAVYALNVKSSS